jgi:hypothetical protein
MIAGFAAESILLKLIKGCPKFKPFKLPVSDALIAIACSTKIGARRLELALPYLDSEYGVSPAQGDWHRVPPTVILDYVFGIDCIVSLLGYAVAIDVTANPDAIAEKVAKLQQLKPLWEALGIDRACICHVSQGQSQTSLWHSLKATLKTEQVIPIAVTI